MIVATVGIIPINGLPKLIKLNLNQSHIQGNEVLYPERIRYANRPFRLTSNALNRGVYHEVPDDIIEAEKWDSYSKEELIERIKILEECNSDLVDAIERIEKESINKQE